MADMEEETVEDHGVKCPYCGYVRYDDLYDYEDGSDHETDCGSCGREFSFDVYTTRTYTARQSNA